MFFNTSLSSNLEDVCFKCERFIVKENKNYKNSIYHNKDVKEIVTLDCGLCERLGKNFNLINIENLEEIKYLNKDEQLLFVSYSMDIPEFVKKHFDFAGYDIVENYNSFLTNFSNEFLKELINVDDLTEFGLINLFDKAHELKQTIDEQNRVDSKVVEIYRMIKWKG